MISSQAYVFETPLIEGVVIKRNSQFTMTIEAEGQNAKAHCPTTTRIGDIDIAGRPFLILGDNDNIVVQLDGEEFDKSRMDEIDPFTIKSINVIKDGKGGGIIDIHIKK